MSDPIDQISNKIQASNLKRQPVKAVQGTGWKSHKSYNVDINANSMAVADALAENGLNEHYKLSKKYYGGFEFSEEAMRLYKDLNNGQ